MYDVKLPSLSAGASCFTRHQYLKCLSLCFHVMGYCCLCLQALVVASSISDCNVCLCVHLHDVHCCLCLQALVAASSISDCNVRLCVHLHDHCCLCLQALSHKTLVTLLEVDPAKKPGTPLPTTQPSITYAYLKHKWHVSRQRVSQQVCASRFCFSLP